MPMVVRVLGNVVTRSKAVIVVLGGSCGRCSMSLDCWIIVLRVHMDGMLLPMMRALLLAALLLLLLDLLLSLLVMHPALVMLAILLLVGEEVLLALPGQHCDGWESERSLLVRS